MMFDLFRRIRMSFLLTAVLTILLGLILILAPGTAVRTIFLVVGWMLLLTGAGSLLTALCSRGKPMGQGDLVLGLIQVATGLVVLMRPGFLLSLAGIVLGFILLLHGVHDIQNAREAKAMGYEYRLSLVVGVVTVVMGLVVMINPFSTAQALLRFAGLFLLLDGLGDLLMVYRSGMK
jgi:uncharacterized membrane protein HdeD (DUF308 family)